MEKIPQLSKALRSPRNLTLVFGIIFAISFITKDDILKVIGINETNETNITQVDLAGKAQAEVNNKSEVHKEADIDNNQKPEVASMVRDNTPSTTNDLGLTEAQIEKLRNDARKAYKRYYKNSFNGNSIDSESLPAPTNPYDEYNNDLESIDPWNNTTHNSYTYAGSELHDSKDYYLKHLYNSIESQSKDDVIRNMEFILKPHERPLVMREEVNDESYLLESTINFLKKVKTIHKDMKFTHEDFEDLRVSDIRIISDSIIYIENPDIFNHTQQLLSLMGQAYTILFAGEDPFMHPDIQKIGKKDLLDLMGYYIYHYVDSYNRPLDLLESQLDLIQAIRPDIKLY